MSFPRLPMFGDFVTWVGPWHQPSFQFFSAATGDLAAQTWSAANRAIFYPVRLTQPTLLQLGFWINGPTVSGNVDIGLYTTEGTRIISSGSTVQTSTNAFQSVDITDTLVGPGRFYVALASDNGVGAFYGADIGTSPPFHKFVGIHTQATAFALPASATFATAASGQIMLCGFAARPVL